jgi:Putative restriction endonuclease
MHLLRHGYNEPMSGSDDVKTAGPGLKLTYDDFVLFPDDGKRHELIDGEHYATPSPNIRHQQISINLTLLIGSWLETHPKGRLFYAPLDVVFSTFDVVEPDLLYVSNERSRVLTVPNVQGAPDLVIESARAAHGSATKRSNGVCTSGRAYRNTGLWIRISTWSVSTGEAATASPDQLSCRARAANRSRPICCHASTCPSHESSGSN